MSSGNQHLQLIAIGCICLFMVCSCGKKADTEQSDSPGEKSSQSNQKNEPPQVVAITVKKETVPLYKEWVGQTQANETVKIRARVEGYLQSASFKEGDFVNKGQVLFQIEKTKYEAALQSAKAQLEKAKAQLSQSQLQVETKEQKALLDKYDAALTKAEQDLARARSLVKQGALSLHELDIAVDAQQEAKAQVESQKAKLTNTGINKTSSVETSRADVDAAEAAVTQAKLNLDYTTIRSPLRGIIGRIDVDPGNLVSLADNATLATISSVDPIKVVINLSEAEYLKYAKEYDVSGKSEYNPLQLYLADNSLYPLKGQFRLVDRAVDNKTGTISVETVFPNPKAILRPGQFAKIRAVDETRKDAIVIPDKCIQDLQGTKVVYVVGADNKVVQRTLTLGPQVKDKVVVEKGLAPGEKVIIEGQQKAHPGDAVILTMAQQ